jgi:phage terminase large subunit GpA-like protein
MKYYVPCPHCGGFQTLIFKNLKWEKINEKNDRDKAEETAHYRCVHCGEKIGNQYKLSMLRGGFWAEDGQMFKEKHGEIYYTPGKSRARIHFDLSSLYSPVLSFGDVAGEFVRATQGEGKRRLQNFINSWLAETFSETVKEYDWKDLKILCADTPEGAVPEWVVFITAGVDLGRHQDAYVVRGWGAGGRSRLIAHGVVNHETDAPNFDALEANIFGVRFGGGQIQVMLCGIDSGYKTYDVYGWCNAMNVKYGECCRPIKGQPRGAPYYVSRMERSGADGAPLEEGVNLWNLNDSHWKGFVTGKYAIPAGRPGAWEIPFDVDEVYLRSLTSEVLQEQTDAKGHVKYEWIVIDKSIGNHYLDAEKICAAMADMCGWRELNAPAVAVKEGGAPAPAAAKPREADGYWEGSGPDIGGGFWE